jgi:hypothetical protein
MRVKHLGAKGRTALVEWHEDGETFRSFVPEEYVSMVGENGYEVENPHQGRRYGVDWEQVVPKIFIELTGVDVAYTLSKELKRVGIWTVEDAKARPQLVTMAIQTAIGLTARSLVSHAKDYLEKDHGNDESA